MSRLATARTWYGAALLLAPDALVERLAGAPTGRTFGRLRRALGARHLIQALVAGRTDDDRWRRLGGGVNLLHALSMVPVLALDPAHRRGVALDLAVEATFALAELRRW